MAAYRFVLAVTCAGVLALLAAAPPAAAVAPCTSPISPARSHAWRAYVPPLTPIRTRFKQHAASAPITLEGAWRLALGARRTPTGTCLVRIRLNRRPNTARAWVAAQHVRLSRTLWRIEVRRATRRLTLLRRGRAVRRWRVVVGKPATPTPTGLFAIQASYRTPPSSFSGSWILALTAHSEILTTFDGGDGQVALHGRGGASLANPLGTAASHGCVRLANAAITSIVHRIGRGRLQGVPLAIR
ncbi:MAG: L,D-transpeptidase [Actinomycetota bacterium]